MEMERGTSPTMTGFSLVVNTETQAQASSVISGAAQRDQEANRLPVVTQMGICLCPLPTPTVTQHQCPAVDCNEDGKTEMPGSSLTHTRAFATS